MDDDNRVLRAIGVVVAVLACVAGWLAIPQIQSLLGSPNLANAPVQTVSVPALPTTYTSIPIPTTMLLVPDLIDLSKEAAISQIVALGLTPIVVETIDERRSIVIEQSPSPGVRSTQGESVTITVGIGVPTPIPTIPLQPVNLVVNGDFQQDWRTGWIRWDDGRGTSSVSSLDAGGGKALHLSHTGPGAIAIYQEKIPAGNLNLIFRARALFGPYRELGPIGFSGLPVSGIQVEYDDSNNNKLGATQFLGSGFILAAYGAPNIRASTSTEHFIKVASEDWTPVELDIAQELRTYLPGVNPSEIAYISIGIFVMNSEDCNCSGEVFATDVELYFKE